MGKIFVVFPSTLGIGQVGEVTPAYSTSVTVSGVSSTGAIGAVLPAVSFQLNGVSGTGAVGSVTNTRSSNVIPIGVFGTGAIGTVNITGRSVVPDAQTPNWTIINPDIAA